MKKRVMILTAISSLIGSMAWSDTIQLGMPIYGGTGCPQDSASAVLSPDNTSLSILFDQYQVQAGNSVGKSMDRKSCDIAIPVHVPQGLSVSILKVDYRGFNSIPAGGYSMLTAQYFFAGSQGPVARKTFMGPLESDYDMNNTLQAIGLVWSPCGQDVNLRANTSMFLKTNASYDDAMSTVDSMDTKASIQYLLQWRSCN